MALCACGTQSRDDGEDDPPADAGVEATHDPGPRTAAVTPRLSARIASSAQALGGGASDTCLVDTSDTDFQAGTLTSCDATTSPGDVYEVQSGPCVVTDHTLTSTAPGTCVIAANQPGDTGYNAAPAVTASVTTAETDNGCSCRSANPSPASGVWILIVAFGLRRRRRASR